MTNYQRATLGALLASRDRGYTWQLWARGHARQWLLMLVVPDVIWIMVCGVPRHWLSCVLGLMIGISLGVFSRDISRFRSHRAAWPVWERVIDWTEAERLLNEPARD